jgi:hypothetical protein
MPRDEAYTRDRFRARHEHANAPHAVALLRPRRERPLAEKAAIGAIEGWGTAEDAAVTPDRGRHVDFVHRVAFENLILGDQSCGAFGDDFSDLGTCSPSSTRRRA